MTCCHTYRPQPIEHVRETMLRIIHHPSVLAKTSTLTPTTLANPSHNSRVPRAHPPSRATTQGIPRALTPIPSHNSRDTFRAITQGTPAIPPLKHHQKACRSRLQNQPKVATAKSPGGASFQIAWRGMRIAKRLRTTKATDTAWRDDPHRLAHAL
ncbi:hypothetical protein DEO72_LG11g2247 [Vigna unguiculata]|uniref:Uncharacterized protein n=1 Tax=Vigna unguiculata TaxID=3917 RepID=A0A4D6NPJ2_VIGUN|nr:hypothetical protein DEO72_LG11g2247 [Vigna unguiculata]